LIESFLKSSVTLGFHHTVDSGKAHVTFATFGKRVLDKGDRTRHIDGVNSDAKNIGACALSPRFG
jgi:hypothetical protein